MLALGRLKQKDHSYGLRELQRMLGAETVMLLVHCRTGQNLCACLIQHIGTDPSQYNEVITGWVCCDMMHIYGESDNKHSISFSILIITRIK